MSVGTETEKFWDSLWELQAECTGLLWVERHPWARGDLGQSAQRQERKQRGGTRRTGLDTIETCPKYKQRRRRRKKEKVHTKADRTLQLSESNDLNLKKRKKNDSKQGDAFCSHFLPADLLIHMAALKKNNNNTKHGIPVTHRELNNSNRQHLPERIYKMIPIQFHEIKELKHSN